MIGSRRGAWSSSFDKLRMRTIYWLRLLKNLILSLSKHALGQAAPAARPEGTRFSSQTPNVDPL